MNQPALSALIWSVADLLRGDYRQSEYGRVILPFCVLRRLDCVLAPTKAAVLAEQAARERQRVNPEPFLLRVAGLPFVNTSPLDLPRLMGDPDHLKSNLFAYLQGFTPAVRDIFERFDFTTQIERLAKAGLLYLVTERFVSIDLSPQAVDNHQMGLIFEELIRRFAEISNETAGEHFTPREVVRLMVNLLFIEDDEVLSPGSPIVRTLYDPTAGSGGMLSVAGEYLLEHNPAARLTMYGQELNPESYAMCKADMLIKGQDVSNICFGNTLSDDGHAARRFDYMLSNPPFGVEWKKVEREVRKEHEQRGFAGRFGPGLPRVSDGSLLFLLHLIAKMRPADQGGSRFGIVLNGSPLFTGGAGGGESEIRRYVLENDLLEAIVGLPTDMFYNTGISTYVWILSNRKPRPRAGKVQLIDASGFWQKMRKSLGSKRKELGEGHIAEITRLFGDFAEADLITETDANGKELTRRLVDRQAPDEAALEGRKRRRVPIARLFDNQAFGYRTITVERPLRLAFAPHNAPSLAALQGDAAWARLAADRRTALLSALAGLDDRYPGRTVFYRAINLGLVRVGGDNLTAAEKKLLQKHLGRPDPTAEVCTSGGRPEPDPSLRDTENVPLAEEVQAYFAREVLPHAPDAWIDPNKTRVGYEIPFNRHFYVFEPPRPLEEIDAELAACTGRIKAMIEGMKA